MGAGRPRKTPAELKLSGVTKQHGYRKNWNTSETPCAALRTRAPQRYLKETKAAWTSFMEVKAVQGVLSEEDMAAVTMMFNALDNDFRMQVEIDKIYHAPDFGEKVMDPEERKKLKDLVQIQKMHETAFFSMSLRFGMTPTERSKLTVKEQQQKSPMLMLLEAAED